MQPSCPNSRQYHKHDEGRLVKSLMYSKLILRCFTQHMEKYHQNEFKDMKAVIAVKKKKPEATVRQRTIHESMESMQGYSSKFTKWHDIILSSVK